MSLHSSLFLSLTDTFMEREHDVGYVRYCIYTIRNKRSRLFSSFFHSIFPYLTVQSFLNTYNHIITFFVPIVDLRSKIAVIVPGIEYPKIEYSKRIYVRTYLLLCNFVCNLCNVLLKAYFYVL